MVASYDNSTTVSTVLVIFVFFQEIPTLDPVLDGNLPFSANITGLNILPVFETLPSQRKIMFSLFKGLCHGSPVHFV